MHPQVSWPQGTECVARYNFKGTSEQDLSFNKGDVLTIIVVTKVMLHYVTFLSDQGFCFMQENTCYYTIIMFQDPNWYKAKNAAGQEGTIPANYVQKREGVKSGGKLSLMP